MRTTSTAMIEVGLTRAASKKNRKTAHTQGQPKIQNITSSPVNTISKLITREYSSHITVLLVLFYQCSQCHSITILHVTIKPVFYFKNLFKFWIMLVFLEDGIFYVCGSFFSLSFSKWFILYSKHLLRTVWKGWRWMGFDLPSCSKDQEPLVCRDE